MAALRQTYHRAKQITLVVDNYIIHKSGIIRCFLSNNLKFRLLFQPVYYLWVNDIELRWKQLHDNVTRNHRYLIIKQLMRFVSHFVNHVAPFSGNNISLMKVHMYGEQDQLFSIV